MLQAEGAGECLRRNIPFVIYALPGDEECRFMASLPDAEGESHARMEGEGDCFFISRFASDEPYMAGVTDEMDEEALVDFLAEHPDTMYDGCDERPYLTSTRRVSYDEAFHMMTRRLKKDGGKVVLSRHEALFGTADIIDTARSYFSLSPNTLRYLCFTPENGVWLGATPELLLEAVPGSGELHTMALAGTRPAGVSGVEWDDKNMLEHEVVVRFITDVLRSHDLEVTTDPITELEAGIVTHLCTPITARGEIKSAGRIINDLNPTPAVAGWPRQLAIAEIDAYETHQRRCYSGITGVRQGGVLRVFVNLRCAFAAQARIDEVTGWVYNLYAGGGLMPDSVLDEEWAETERKLAALYACIESPVTSSPGTSPGPVTVNPTEARFLY